MTGKINTLWVVRLAAAPRPLRHCGGCGVKRPFASSGRVRLNANGRRLDAWLIYRCDACDRTWNRPLLDRVPLKSIAPDDLAAMEQSDAEWVASHEHDLTDLKRFCVHIETADGVRVEKPTALSGVSTFDVVRLRLRCDGPVSMRLDRFLAQEFCWSRSKVQLLWRIGVISAAPAVKRGLRMPVSGIDMVSFDLLGMGEQDRSIVVEAVVR